MAQGMASGGIVGSALLVLVLKDTFQEGPSFLVLHLIGQRYLCRSGRLSFDSGLSSSFVILVVFVGRRRPLCSSSAVFGRTRSSFVFVRICSSSFVFVVVVVFVFIFVFVLDSVIVFVFVFILVFVVVILAHCRPYLSVAVRCTPAISSLHTCSRLRA